MQCGLLIIGDEVLNGQTQDTNSGFAARLLNGNGIAVTHILTVRDNDKAIKEGLAFLLERSDLVISTGGLGPTKDDITKAAITEFFGSKLIFNDDVYQNLTERFKKRGLPVNRLNQAQAMVPEIATVFQNTVGSAPVFWIERDDKVFITLPGVPAEMRFLLEHTLLSRIKERFVEGAIVQKNIYTVGIAESSLAMMLEGVEAEIEGANNEDEWYKLAYLPDLNIVKLQLTGSGKDENSLKHQLESFTEKIEQCAHEYIFGYDNDVFASYIGKILKERDATLCTAESCTGGYLAHLITSVTGSADYYKGSIVTYWEEVKENELGVKKETLEKYSAVSEETLREMVDGALAKFDTTYAIAVTGIAGPTGGTEETPLGTVWIGVGSKYRMETKKFMFDRGRLDNIHLAAVNGLDMLRRFILGYKI